jgi:hypothetical protein
MNNNLVQRMNTEADNMEEKDKELLANAATAAAIGIGAVVGGVPLALLGGCLWAIKRKN